MQKFTKLTSKVVPLPIKDVDTDMLIPAQYLTQTTSGGYGEHLFERLRSNDPSFPLNLPKYQGGQVLVAYENFGCGSSREHAVWALLQHGFQVVIAPDFADIFFSNSAKNGLVLVKLDKVVVEGIVKEAQAVDSYEVEVSLVDQKVVLPSGEEFSFDFDKFRKDCIINGLDDLGYIRQFESEIDIWNSNRQKNTFYKTTEVNY